MTTTIKITIAPIVPPMMAGRAVEAKFVDAAGDRVLAMIHDKLSADSIYPVLHEHIYVWAPVDVQTCAQPPLLLKHMFVSKQVNPSGLISYPTLQSHADVPGPV